MDFAKLYQGIDEEDRLAIEAMPRAERLPQIATLQNVATREKVMEIAELSGLPYLEDIDLVDNPAGILPLRLINEYQCVPIKNGQSKVEKEASSDETGPDTSEDAPIPLVTLWPPDQRMDRWIYAACGRQPKWYLGDPEHVSNTITQRFGVGADSLDESDILSAEADVDEEEDEDAAVIRFVNEVVHKAVNDRATDIHFEPHRDELQIRYRIDGELVPIRVPDNLIKFQDAIISRLKIMAKLNISEKRRLQDGRISFGAGDSELDIRISTFPTMYGESVSLRLLNQNPSHSPCENWASPAMNLRNLNAPSPPPMASFWSPAPPVPVNPLL